MAQTSVKRMVEHLDQQEGRFYLNDHLGTPGILDYATGDITEAHHYIGQERCWPILASEWIALYASTLGRQKNGDVSP